MKVHRPDKDNEILFKTKQGQHWNRIVDSGAATAVVGTIKKYDIT